MKGEPIHYRQNYKYQLTRDWEIDLNLFLPFPPMEYVSLNDFVILETNGLMKFRFAYAWDGCSGPTIDDETNMRTGLIHDGGCQLIREGLLPESYRAYFDKLLELVGLDDGMVDIRALYYRKGVELSNGDYAKKGYCPYPEQTAPNPDRKQE